MENLTAIIVAAGSSQRLGFDKLTADLCGQPVLRHAVQAFATCAFVDRCIVVTREDRIHEMQDLLHDFAKPLDIISGGKNRHDSVWAGIQEAGTAQWISVHDGARPLIRPDAIEACFALARAHGSATCAEPVANTLKRADADHRIVAAVDRTDLWAMQTPQIFRLALLRSAYEKVIADGQVVTDETSALAAVGAPVFLYENPGWNFKITFPRDLDLARAAISFAGKSPDELT